MLAAEWMLRDDKANVRGAKHVQYPCTVRTYDRRDVTAHNREELFRLCTETDRQDGSVTTKLIVAGVHPEQFITDESMQLLSLFSRFKRYGLEPLFGADVSALVLQAFDVISNVIDRQDANARRELKERSRKSK